MSPPTYDQKRIRSLLTQSFSSQELRELCFFEPQFEGVYDSLPQQSSKNQQVLHILQYAKRRGAIKVILKWAEQKKPDKFKAFGPYVVGAKPANQEGQSLSRRDELLKMCREEPEKVVQLILHQEAKLAEIEAALKNDSNKITPKQKLSETDIEDDPYQRTVNQIDQLKHKLHARRVQRASLGLNVPPEVILEIEELESEIAQLEDLLKQL